VQLCRGMKHLHSKKVAHKDFKSLNVLLEGKLLKISDFNSSKEETGATMAGDGGNDYGTPAWTAPEMFHGQAASPYPSDTYSLGVVLWEISTRSVPWQGKKIADIIAAVGFRQERPGEPTDSPVPQIQNAIRGCWEHKPEDRPTAQEVLQMVLGADQTHLPPPTQAAASNMDEAVEYGAKMQRKNSVQHKNGSTFALPPQPLPDGWAEAVDPGSGATYYMHHASKSTQWDRPT